MSKVPERELVDLKRLLSHKQRTYFYLYKFHKVIKPFYDPEHRIKLVPYVCLILFTIGIYLLTTTLNLDATLIRGIQLVILFLALYVFFIFAIHYEHEHLEREMKNIELQIDDLKDHMVK